MGPLYIKVGQILSTRPDLVSASMITELQKLHDQAAVSSFTVMEPVLAEELGPAWRKWFSDVDTHRPLASASLAQVYRARLSDGTPVVLKVQRPGLRPTMEADMRMLRHAARMTARHASRFSATVDLDAMLSVLFDAMRPELDFRKEAQHMETARHTMGDYPNLRIPQVVHVTPRLLVQSLAPGHNIRDADRTAFKEDERLAIGKDLLRFMYASYFVHRFFHADPHPGNVLVAPGEPASVIDWGMVGRIDRQMSMALMLILLSLAGNDGEAAARAWIDMGKPTPWADLSGFTSDVRTVVPRVAAASLGELDFGATLSTVLKFSTRRGIQTSPVVSILGKSFANIDGTVRHLAPELSVTEAFTSELPALIEHFVKESLSPEHLARHYMNQLILQDTVLPATRTFLRDLTNRESTLRVPCPESESSGTRNGSVSTWLIGALALFWWRTRGNNK
jgi:ubiquinone biosynthesis protein